MNVLAGSALIDYNVINRYSMCLLSFGEISYEVYLVQVLLLRFQTVIMLWILGRILPEKIVYLLFGYLICGLLGGIFAIAILANGVWGSWFVVCAMMPHGIFYMLAYRIWYYKSRDYSYRNSGKERIVIKIFIVLLVIIGSICEAYISPELLEKVVKF